MSFGACWLSLAGPRVSRPSGDVAVAPGTLLSQAARAKPQLAAMITKVRMS